MKYPFREIDISEIENVKIGNAEDLEHATVCPPEWMSEAEARLPERPSF